MAEIQNITAVKKALRAAVQQKVQRMTQGLTQAGLLLQRESMKIVPVDFGNLKATAFTRCEGAGTANVIVYVGYTAAYAVFVHENVDALHGAAFNQVYAQELSDMAAIKRRKSKGITTAQLWRTVLSPFRHNRGPNQQAKFLESPFRRLINQMRTIVANHMRKP